MREPEYVAVNGKFTSVLLRSPNKATYRCDAQLLNSVPVPPLRGDAAPMRLSVAIIKEDSTLVGLPQCLDMMGYRWLDAVWHI